MIDLFRTDLFMIDGSTGKSKLDSQLVENEKHRFVLVRKGVGM